MLLLCLMAPDPDEPNHCQESKAYGHEAAHSGFDWYGLVMAAEAKF